jgi:hypothetical protein
MVCAKRTLGSEIMLDPPDGTLDAHFGLFGDSANPDAR